MLSGLFDSVRLIRLNNECASYCPALQRNRHFEEASPKATLNYAQWRWRDANDDGQVAGNIFPPVLGLLRLGWQQLNKTAGSSLFPKWPMACQIQIWIGREVKSGCKCQNSPIIDAQSAVAAPSTKATRTRWDRMAERQKPKNNKAKLLSGQKCFNNNRQLGPPEKTLWQGAQLSDNNGSPEMAKITEEIGRGDWGKCLASSICGRLLPIFRNKRHPPLKYTQKNRYTRWCVDGRYDSSAPPQHNNWKTLDNWNRAQVSNFPSQFRLQQMLPI